MLLSKRKAVADEYLEWIKENKVADCPLSMVSFFSIKGIIKEPDHPDARLIEETQFDDSGEIVSKTVAVIPETLNMNKADVKGLKIDGKLDREEVQKEICNTPCIWECSPTNRLTCKKYTELLEDRVIELEWKNKRIQKGVLFKIQQVINFQDDLRDFMDGGYDGS